MTRRRLLDRLCDLHPRRDREELLSHVLCGDVVVDDERVRDPRREVAADSTVRIAPDPARRYVSRGGLKLERALSTWELDVSDAVVLDAGASTGGFTDCLLQHGARTVHAVDVGYNQLDYRLRRDPRVIAHERTNIMEVNGLEPPPTAAVADLSFRSLRGAAAHLWMLVDRSWMVLLIKPQFEWANPPPEFNGTVPDAAVRPVLEHTLSGLAGEGIPLSALIESPVRGRRGNREFLLLAGRRELSAKVDDLLAGLAGPTS